MAKTRFVPLHTHSHYSLLEGVDGPEAMLARAGQLGYPALALTDTANLHGAVAFIAAAQRYGVRPILGACLRGGSSRCTALIAEPVGYRSLCRVLARLGASGQDSLPTLLAANAEGLHVLVDDESMVKSLYEAFRHRLWLEIIRPGPSIHRERRLLEAGYSLGIKPVASLAAHFAADSGFDTYGLLAAVRSGKPGERATGGPVSSAHHLADPEAVYERFRDLPDAVVNTERLAECCRSDVLPRGLMLPPPHLAAGQDAVEHLRLLCDRGLSRRFAAEPRASRQRLEQELAVIRQRDLEPYFLTVHAIAEEAHRQGIPMALRGSAGNSLVCYLLGITDVDPMRFDLRFERFLHPGRPDLPDIDLDFDARSRGRMLTAVIARYGQDHCALVGVLQTLQPRSAFRQAARLYGLNHEQVRRILATESGWLDHFRDGPRLPALPSELPPELGLDAGRWDRLLADARQLLDRPSELCAHPSGLVITVPPAEDYLPLWRRGRSVGIAHFDQEAVERIGLVKIDLLSNRSLSGLSEARRHLTELGEAPPGLSPDDADPKTLALLQQGETLGISQLETPLMQRLLCQLRPQRLEDLIQALALIRPAAASGGSRETFLRRRRGLEPVRFEHPCLAPLLGDSCGVMLYEDDCLLVIHALTGLPLPEADRLRRQLAEDGTAPAGIELLRASSQRNGIPAPAVESIARQLAKFSGYAFCKSHAVSYGLIAWQAAALKAHHPVCFWTAVLNHHRGVYERRSYIEAIKRAGIAVLLPCINRSAVSFTQEVSGIRTGLSAVRGLSETTITTLIEERQRGGPFRGLADFQQRLPLSSSDLARLIRTGAFDADGRSRAVLLREAGVEASRDGRARPLTAADTDETTTLAPWLAGFPLAQQWQAEWELLGFLAGPLLMQLCRASLPTGLGDSRDLASRLGEPVSVAGLLALERPGSAENGAKHALVLEDEWGLIEATVEPDGLSHPLVGMGPWRVEGQVGDHHGVPFLAARRVERATIRLRERDSRCRPIDEVPLSILREAQ
jgi:error-prone DNA polymerase